MKQKMFLGVALFLAISMANLFGQVRIGDNADPHQGAILDLTNASNLGMLLPRVSLSDVSVWSLTGNPADGTAMVVYNTNNSVIGGNGSGVYVWDGSAWKPFKPLVAVTGVSLDKPT
ncbi:MAG: hypothetical protein LBG77_07020, partial [Dysgonamonadaceae bacterium]|nr:hypothetical protein [Dysgonamonadaceae bacterium]